MEKINIICMKWGNKFSPDYVNKLFNMVQRNLSIEHDFICFTDDKEGLQKGIIIKKLEKLPIGQRYYDDGCWPKLLMFKKNFGNLSGVILFLDLDTVIISDIAPMINFIQQNREKVVMLQERKDKHMLGVHNSAFVGFIASKWDSIFDEYINNYYIAHSKYRTEQAYLSHQLGENVILWPQNWCISFKRHLVPKGMMTWFKEVPEPNAEIKMVAFHGHPMPHEAVEGKWKTKPWKMLKPVIWLKKYWK